MIKLAVIASCLSLYAVIASATQGSFLPSAVQNQKKPIDEKFHKFWKRKVLDGLLHYDYDVWFRRFLNFPSHLKNTVGSQLSCPPIKNHATPTSVHRLTPKDISIVAALGDSATSGFGARSSSLVNLFADFRGIAWSIGGDASLEKVLTLPNILKKYNPLVKGYSKRMTSVSDRKKNFSGNNFAKTGSTAEGMAENVEELISFMKKSGESRMKSSWKLLTIFIGEQDLCLSCFERDYAAKNFVKKISNALEKIQEKLPRVMVNLVQVYDVTELHKVRSPYCKAFLKVTCPCVAAGARQRAHVAQTAREYSLLLQNLVNSPKFRDTRDFAVVLQPFLSNTVFPKTKTGNFDHSFFAPDCFHLSAKGQAAMAAALWNNMLQPVGEKSTRLDATVELNCPRPNFPYFFTKTNSKEYNKLGFLAFNFFPAGKNIQLHKSVKAHERETKKKPEAEKEVRHRSLGIAIGSGLVVAAIAVGVVLLVVKKKRSGAHGGIAGEPHRSYQSCDQETLL